MADTETAARARLARLHEEEQLREQREAPPPYRPLIDPGEVIDFGAWATAHAKANGLSIPKTAEELAARNLEREREAAALLVPCDAHSADPGLACQPGTRTAPRVLACESRRACALAAEARREEAARALELDAVAARLHESGVPERHCEIIAGGVWKDWDSLRLVQAWYPTTAAALLLAGEMDAGKSGALAWLLSQPPRLHRHVPALRRFHDSTRVAWVSASALAQIDAWEREGRERPRFLWADLLEVPRLVIDDIGRVAGVGSEATIHNRFTNLLGERLERNLDTYMSTNLGKREEVAAMLEPQVWHRLQAWADIVVAKQTGLREAQRAERKAQSRRRKETGGT